MVKIGDKLPSVTLFEDTPDIKLNTSELAHGKNLIIFGLPGAFTPGCSSTHLPGYVNDAHKIKADLGVDEIICVSVNDPYVMCAWGKQNAAAGKVRLLADPNCEFAKALDLSIDMPALGGLRSKRYSMIVTNGIVTELNIEQDVEGLTCSLADRIGKKKSI